MVLLNCTHHLKRSIESYIIKKLCYYIISTVFRNINWSASSFAANRFFFRKQRYIDFNFKKTKNNHQFITESFARPRSCFFPLPGAWLYYYRCAISDRGARKRTPPPPPCASVWRNHIVRPRFLVCRLSGCPMSPLIGIFISLVTHLPMSIKVAHRHTNLR